MKLSFRKKKKTDDEVRSAVASRLGVIKKGEKNERLTEDVPGLVKGLADGDG